MFFSMLNKSSQYRFTLIASSFLSFFMLAGLSSVSHGKSTHEKPRQKSMMAQKASYRVLAISPEVLEAQAIVPNRIILPVVFPQVAAPQPQAVPPQEPVLPAIPPQAVPPQAPAFEAPPDVGYDLMDDSNINDRSCCRNACP